MLVYSLQHNAELMTETVRYAPKAVAYSKSADLSEAHAHAGMVKSIAYGLLCEDIPRVTGFVESDASQVISPAKYFLFFTYLKHPSNTFSYLVT